MYQNFRSIQENIMLIEGALHGDFVIPEFGQFTKHLQEIYHHCKENAEGKVGMNDLMKIKMHSYYHTSNSQTYVHSAMWEMQKSIQRERRLQIKTGQFFHFIIAGIWLDLTMKETDLIMIENLHKIFVTLYYGQETKIEEK